MSEYKPDTWVMLKFVYNGNTVYKVLAGWYGGYTGAESWKLNSGCVRVEREGNEYLFHGHSGSVYRCHKDSYKLSAYTNGLYLPFKKDVEVVGSPDVTMELLPEDTDFEQLSF